MDTILNLGLNDDNVKSLLTKQMMRALHMIVTVVYYKCLERLFTVFQ